jgi:tetratricopeptide (TPR) repeat protein
MSNWHGESKAIDFEKQLRAAQGYYELGMLEEAWDEVLSIEPTHQDERSVLHVKLLLQLKSGQWDMALETSRCLCEIDPDDYMGYIHAAYCLHEMGKTLEARQLLMAGPRSLREKAVYYYNIGCYEVTLGRLEKGRRNLEQSFEIDRHLVAVARQDPDLADLWDVI